MYLIKAQTPGTAWKKASKLIFENGYKVKDGNLNLLELLNVTIVVQKPCQLDSIINKYASSKNIDWMKQNFLSSKPIHEWGYSYGQRLKDFNHVNQIQAIISKLTKNRGTKSATATLMLPPQDKHHIPCITTIDFKIRHSKLSVSVFIRSQDVINKLYADIIAIGTILNQVAKQTKAQPSQLIFYISSLHLYLKDKAKLDKLLSLK